MDNHNRSVLNSKDHSIADFPLALQIIFDYLPGTDLISCLAVCKSTNFEIATSEKLMDKIVLIVPRGHKMIADQILNNTNRKYKHISIQHEYEYGLDFKNDFFKWKSLHIQRTIFCSTMWKFLEQFKKTISELNFSFIKVELCVDQKFPIFDKLETLKIKCEVTETAMIYYEFQMNFPGLKHLTISQFGYEFAISVIKRTKYDVFLDTMHLTQPKLASFWTVEHVLKGQKNCLKELTLEKLNSSAMENIWKEMKVLKKLTIGKKIPAFRRNMALATNNSINEIVIHSTTVPFYVYEQIVNATPNLKILRVTNKNNPRRDLKVVCNTYYGPELREFASFVTQRRIEIRKAIEDGTI